MSNTKNLVYASAGIAAGLGAVWLVRRSKPDVNNLAIWQRVLAHEHGADRALLLAKEVRQRYAALLSLRPLPAHPALRRHLTASILPGLALYQTLLREYDDDRQAALSMVNRALRASVLAQAEPLLAPMKILPTPFWLVRLAMKLQMLGFPSAGWDTHYLEDSPRCMAFNMTRCFYLDTLSAYGAPELTASFCKTDDVMAELLPSSVRFTRPHTMGRGDTLCDFQYCEVRDETIEL